MPARPRAALLVAAALLAGAGAARAQAEPPIAESEAGGLSLRELESWIVLDDELAPEPPLVRLDVGAVAWIELQSRLRVDRRGVPGADLRALEDELRLPSTAGSPWVELSLGSRVRGGADFLWLARQGPFVRAERTITFNGVDVAGPGDLVDLRLELFTTSAFVSWDPLAGQTYRIGFVGGARYFRLQSRVRAVRPAAAPIDLSERAEGELVSPYFGGSVELVPFPYLSVTTRIQYMSWSWSAVRLREARFFDFRAGAHLRVVPDRLALGLEARYLAVAASARRGADGRRFEAELAGFGASFVVQLAF